MTTRLHPVRAHVRKSPDRPNYLDNTVHTELREAFWPNQRVAEVCEAAIEQAMRGFDPRVEG